MASDGQMRIKARPFLAWLLDPFGHAPRSLDLTGEGIAIRGGRQGGLMFDSLVSAPTVQTGVLGASVTLLTENDEALRLQPLALSEATAFVETAGQVWQLFNQKRLQAEGARIDRLLAALADLENPQRYPAACLWSATQHDAAALHASLLSKLAAQSIGTEAQARLSPIRRFATDPVGMRNDSIARYVAAELTRWQDFFDTVESKPLTPEQSLSVVVDEDATLVLAGAGSGKTSVITAKAAYLVKAGIRRLSRSCGCLRRWRKSLPPM